MTFLEQLEKNAYNKGHADGMAQGLNDAWELAKKCVDLEGRGEDNELMFKIFNTVFLKQLFNDNTPQEALAKLKAYEEAQNKIEVGDVVKCKGFRYEYVVMATSEETFSNQPFLRCLEPPYQVSYGSDEELIKTGKHINIMEQILEQIGE